MNREQAKEFCASVARIDRETADVREKVELLLSLFICPVCDGEGWIEDDEFDSGMATCDHCDGVGYTRKCGVK